MTQQSRRDAQGIADNRNKRVRQACERCRIKKTKCDGQFPCKKCKDGGLLCTAGARKTEYDQHPEGYAEILENTQFVLVATVHKLYEMVRNEKQWDFGEPELSYCGQPIVQSIASKLGCIRSNGDLNLSACSGFPEDVEGPANAAQPLETNRDAIRNTTQAQVGLDSTYHLPDCSRTSKQSYPSSEADYAEEVSGKSNTAMTTLPYGSAGSDYFNVDSVPHPVDTASLPQYVTWKKPMPTSTHLPLKLIQSTSTMTSTDMLNPALIQSEFGSVKPGNLSRPNPEIAMSRGHPKATSDAMPLNGGEYEGCWQGLEGRSTRWRSLAP